MIGFIFIILIIMGVLQIIFPKQMFMFGKRWQFKEGVEPSEISVFFTRLSGVIVIMFSFIFLFQSF